jgi:hypothetical protein
VQAVNHGHSFAATFVPLQRRLPSAVDHQMDYGNNTFGRQIGVRYDDNDKVQRSCQYRANGGFLYTIFHTKVNGQDKENLTISQGPVIL